MKTIRMLAMTIVIALISIPLSAQQGFSFGLEGGLVLSGFYSDIDTDLSNWDVRNAPQTGFQVNTFAAYRFKKPFGISFSPGFILKGGDFVEKENDPLIDPSRIKMNLYYLQFPLFGDFHIGKKFIISAGPELSYLIKAEAKLDNGDKNDVMHMYGDARLEISGIVAGSYRITDRIDIALTFSHGINPIRELYYTDQNGNDLGSYKEFNRYCSVKGRFRI